jgi:DNA-directed RNA polymerase subunit RPC12/RpoP
MKKTDGIRDVFKNVNRRKPTQIYCPRCASSKIGLSNSLAIWLTPKEYFCENCGYRGIIVMELEKDEKEET